MNERRALLSVTDKTGLVDFARGLIGLGFQLLSTGGTRKILEEAGLAVTDVAEHTGSPELLDGRVKTLHPRIHGGILARRDDARHTQQLETHGIPTIDVVVVNLYDFETASKRASASVAEVVEEIDIGGPTLLRAAAKNHAFVLPVVDPSDYPEVLSALGAPGGPSEAFRRGLASKVFAHTHRYDGMVSAYFARLTKDGSAEPAERMPERISFSFDKVQDLRYGENPHQVAAFYRAPQEGPASLASAVQKGGKELSYNNLLDADSALRLVMDLGPDAAVYIKHNNPCGAAVDPVLLEALRKARDVDPVSAFGAVVAMGKPVDVRAASLLAETFLEVILAPGFSPEAIEVLGKKKNLRLLELRGLAHSDIELDLRRVQGGLLVQTEDGGTPRAEVRAARVVTKRSPSEEEREALEFAWVVAKHVRSNAIVYGYRDRVAAVGAGQMSRVDSAEIARHKAKGQLSGTVAASDAFFPFRDGLDQLAAAGATAVVQPGGSVRDEEVIAAADEHGLAMIFTGVRHFRH